MRRRMLNPEFFTDPDIVANFDAFGRLFYQGLWCVAEDSGCFELNPLFLKMKIFPGDNISLEQIQEYIDTLVYLKKISIYEVTGKKYGWLKNFHKHQTLNKPSSPTVPLPRWIIWHGEDEFDKKRHEYYYEIIEKGQAQDESRTEEGQVQGEDCPEEKLREEKLREENINNSCSDSVSPNPTSDRQKPDPGDVNLHSEKEQEIKFNEDSIPYKAALHLRDRILGNNKRAQVPNKDPVSMEPWTIEMDRLNRLGPVGAKDNEGKGYNWQEIRIIIDWCQEHEFWKSNILSPGKLREKITTLDNQLKRDGPDQSKSDAIKERMYIAKKADKAEGRVSVL